MDDPRDDLERVGVDLRGLKAVAVWNATTENGLTDGIQ